MGQKVVGGHVEAFLSFDPHKDIIVGQFVAVSLSPVEKCRLDAVFYVGKVRALERAATVDGVMTVTWYWPTMRHRSIDAVGEWHQRYVIWESRCWEPSKEDDDKIMVSSAMIS